ncbi:hypothetical protein ACFVHB_30170 [Kitasatospora sp. NPDC127111]|uniref:hypothetical protein n=1 Tax=Kitasatospora sp. NPDC127111 TaxID=3345363 RepID=UPI00363D8EB5
MIAVLSWALSLVLDRLIESRAKEWEMNVPNTIGLADWAIDASQTAASVAVPILGIEVLFHKSAPEWIPIFYAATAVFSLAASCVIMAQGHPVTYVQRFRKNKKWWMPLPGMTFSFSINTALGIVVFLAA